MTPRICRAIGLSVLCGGLFVIGFGLRLWFPPARYAARARLKVELKRDANATNTYVASFMHNEFELIQSEVILGQVVKALDLHSKWSKRSGTKLNIGDAVTLLKERLDLQPERCTSLVEIRITSEDPEEAAQISNAVAEEYHHQRTGGGAMVSAEVVDAAAIPPRPLTPNRVLALCLFGLGTVLTVAGLCLSVRRVSGVN